MVSAWTFSENIVSIRKHSCKTSKFAKFFQPPCVALGKNTAPSNLKRQLQGGISGSARRTWGFDLPFQRSDWCEGARLIKAGWPKSAQAARTWGMSASMTSTCNTTRAKRCFMLHIEATESEMWELRKKTNWYKPCQQIHRQRVNARVIYFHGALRAFHKYHHYHRAIGSWQMVQIKRKHKSGIDFEAGFFKKKPWQYLCWSMTVTMWVSRSIHAALILIAMRQKTCNVSYEQHSCWCLPQKKEPAAERTTKQKQSKTVVHPRRFSRFSGDIWHL